MTQAPAAFAVGGGLDLVTAPLLKPMGRLIAASNYEPLSTGYGRIEGHERFDGRPAPSAAAMSLIGFTGGTTAIVAGQTIVGAGSGATAKLLTDATVTSGGWAGDDAAGLLYIVPPTGAFITGETLTVAGSPVAIADGIAVAAHDDGPAAHAALIAAQALRRAAITAVPGSGPVRGIGELAGTIYAVRDNEGATAGVLYRATGSGWAVAPLGRILDFSAGLVEIVEGQTISGATSGATATVLRVVKQSGSWGSTAAGYLVFASQTGSFAAETIKVGATNVATIAGNSATITLPPGGRYTLRSHNFYGASNLRRMYGVNGVGNGFEFDGTVLVPIRTGMAVDHPNLLGIFANHLFLTFPGGSIQNSAPGEPLIWDVVLGAEEIGLGDDVTDLIDPTSTALAIFGRGKVAILTGTDSDSFSLEVLSEEAGAIPGTAQSVGSAIYLDQQGLRTLEATQRFGNFATGTLTELVQPLLAALAATPPAASIACKAKTQYRLYWPDGTGLHIHMGGRVPAAAPVALGLDIACALRCDPGGREAMFVGTAGGMVHRIDSGTSADGAPVSAFLQLPYNPCGSPYQEKRFHSVEIGVLTQGASELGVVVDFSARDETLATSFATLTAYPGLALWDGANWDGFYWSTPHEGLIAAHIDGLGAKASLLVASAGDALTPPHVIQTYKFNHSPRRPIR